MFWDNPNDSDLMQRLKNQLFLKIPYTNKTRDEAMPAIVAVSLMILLVAALVAIFRFRLGAPAVLAGCAAAGMAWWAISG